MPQFIPKVNPVLEAIADEQARIQARTKQLEQIFEPPAMESEASTRAREFMTNPETFIRQSAEAMEVPVVTAPRTPTRMVPPVAAPQIESIGRPIEEPEIEPAPLNFWQRALQVFSAPFEWVDKYAIKPGLSIVAGALGMPEVDREEGEDFFDWKRRSWDEWEAPGININIDWLPNWTRFDIKGVAELAPWLLIPGAGTIGGGLVKGAGALGRFGGIAKAVGYGIKYSPWGVVEKATGAVISKGAKALAGGAERLSTATGEKVFGKITPEELNPVIEKFTTTFKAEIAPKLKTRPEILKQQRQVTVAKMAQAEKDFRAGKIDVEDLNKLRVAAEKGEAGFERVAAEPLTQFNGDDVRVLKVAIEAKLSTYDATRAHRLIDELFTGVKDKPMGTIGSQSEWDNLAKALGFDFAKAVRSASGNVGKWDKFLDAANLPRAVLASWDFSATLRQGLILGLMHPTRVPRAFARQMKAFASEKLAGEADDLLRANPLFREFTEEMGGYIAPLKEAAILATREESFMSKFAEKIPGVRRSERAYVTYLNEMRMAAYESSSQVWRAMGATNQDLQGLAKFINAASGRGSVPHTLEQYTPFLNATLFSPRLQLSRLQLPLMLASKNPYVRKEAMKGAVRFIGTGAGLLTLAKYGFGADLELDPRSADFGKIKIGETRLDVWTGYLQFARFAAQMITAERKTAYGNMNKDQRDQIAWRFFQSKSSPAVGLMVDIMRGESYMGEKIFDDTTGALTQAGKRFAPLFIQDLFEAMEQNGTNGMLTAIPGAFGVGVLTYTNELADTRDRVAKKEGYDDWESLDPLTKRRLENKSPVLQKAMIEYDRQVLGTQWGDWKAAGNAIEDEYRENVMNATREYQATGNGVIFRTKVDSASDGRRKGYDTRNRDARFEEIVNRQETEDMQEAMLKLGPEQLAIKTYNDAMYGSDMYDQFGNYDFVEADRRREMFIAQYGQDMMDYVEEYTGAKWDAPEEFQQLKQARETLKPYWAVEENVLRMFGKRFAESNRGQAAITKLRKQMRMRDREIAEAYAQFYQEPK